MVTHRRTDQHSLRLKLIVVASKDVAKTLAGHGMEVSVVNPEGPINDLFVAIRTAILANGPYAVVCRRKMCPGIEGVEGSNHGHDAVSPKLAGPFFTSIASCASCLVGRISSCTFVWYFWSFVCALGMLEE